jgi:hypothetical protein
VCRFLRIEFAWRPSRPFSGLIVLSSARRQPPRGRSHRHKVLLTIRPSPQTE